MSTAIKKPPPPGATGRTPTATSTTASGAARSPSRASASSANASSVARSRSVRNPMGTPTSARASVKRPSVTTSLHRTTSPSDSSDEAAREEAAALIHELKGRLQKAESASGEYQKQLVVLQSKLDDALKEQAKLEEKAHEEEERVEGLEIEKKEALRQRRELESIYEAERVATMKDKELAQAREEELHGIVQRLKESLSQRDARSGSEDEGRLSRASSFRGASRNNSSSNLENGHFAPPATLQRSNSQNNSKLLLQKDKVIEQLRLELAEAQIKLVEVENAGGGRVQELEKILLETRMTNARLLEDNESYQLLLSEKTLNGDFSRGDFLRATNAPESRAPSRHGPSQSLAEELESATGDEAADHIRRLEAEVNSLKDQNKALTLYINKIIERLLQHQGFESILDKTDLDQAQPLGHNRPNTDKDLPPPPPPKSPQQDPAPSFLRRATSVMTRQRPRPISHMPTTDDSPTRITADPNTAPSIPLQRSQSQRVSSGHRRANSEWNTTAATVINNMYRPGVAGGTISPGIVSPRSSFFPGIPVATHGAGPNTHPPGTSSVQSTPRIPSGSSAATAPSDDVVVGTDYSPALDTPSPPRSIASFGDDRRAGGAVMAGKGIKPLRLVQEAAEEAEEQRVRNKANRGSWLGGWFAKGSGDVTGPN